MESFCFKYLQAIRDAIGIADVETNAASWRYVAKTDADEEGAQIDLLLDRADHCINTCEIKFSDKPYVITKSCAKHWNASCVSSVLARGAGKTYS